MTYMKVKEDPSLMRDQESNALINIDNAGLAQYKKQKRQSKQINNMNERIETMEKQLDQLNENIENLLMLFQGRQ